MAIDYFAQQFGEDVYENTAPAAPAFSNADINAFVQANIGNPQAIATAAQQYGVSPEQLSQATGYDANTVSNYFGNAGINFGQPAPQATTPAPLTPQPPVYQPPTYQPPTTPPPQYTDPDPGFAPPTPVTSTQDPNSVQQRIIEEERKRNLEGGLASLGAGNAGGSPKPVDLGDGTYRTYGGTIIDRDGRPVTQATTLAPVKPPPPNLPPVAPKETQYGTVTPYTTTQIKDYVSGVMGDASLTPFERTN
jgi:hypothetical protein